MRRVIHHTKRIAIGIAGAVVVVAGIIMIPYPGPGWLVVFAGLGILATEFPFAEKILTYVRRQYDRWVAWPVRQTWWVRSLTLIFTVCVVIVTIWLVNGFGISNSIFHLDQEWLNSPLV